MSMTQNPSRSVNLNLAKPRPMLFGLCLALCGEHRHRLCLVRIAALVLFLLNPLIIFAVYLVLALALEETGDYTRRNLKEFWRWCRRTADQLQRIAQAWFQRQG